jgi:hypothetical protein
MKYMLGIYFALLSVIFILSGIIYQTDHPSLTQTQLAFDTGMWLRNGPAIIFGISAIMLFVTDDDDPTYV